MAYKGTLGAVILSLAMTGFSMDVWAQQQQPNPRPAGPVIKQPAGKEQPLPPAGKPKAGTEQFKPTGLVYTFTLKSFKITDTRSVHNDTDFVSIGVAGGSKKPPATLAKFIGDLNNGTYAVNVSIADISAADTDAVAFTYAIVNSGHDKNDFNKQLAGQLAGATNLAAQAAASAAGNEIAGNLGSTIGIYIGPVGGKWLFDKISGIAFANCDGIVAAASHVYSGAQLNHQLANGHVISATDDNKGTDSPVGCGSNSRYYVTWTISGHAKPPLSMGH